MIDSSLLTVLARLQAGLVLLSGAGQTVVMGGNPLYLVLPGAAAAALLRGATLADRGSPRALVVLTTVEAVVLSAVPLSALAALTPWLSWTPTLTGLVTMLVLPLALLILTVRALNGVGVAGVAGVAGVVAP